MNATPRYKQADPKWYKDILGYGPSNIGAAGCMLVCLCEAVRELRGVEMPPPMANRIGITNGAFIHSSAKTAKLAGLMGLKVSEKITGDTAMIRASVKDAFRNGGRAILHVDHTGDLFGDHFVLGLREEVDASGFQVLAYADPATGREAPMDANKLKAATTWGSRVKLYSVISMRAVYAA